MAPIQFSDSDSEQVDDDPAISENSARHVDPGEVAEPPRHSATIHPPGTLPDAKRLRSHDPPACEEWQWKPKVVMADGATAVDAAVVKVFAYQEGLAQAGARRLTPCLPLHVPFISSFSRWRSNGY